MKRAVSSLLLAALSLEACSTRYLPPPRAPARIAPTGLAEAPPPRDGEGPITLDVENGPARADLVTGRTQVMGAMQGWGARGRMAIVPGGVQLTTRPLCITPCVVNLPLGQNELAFTALDESSGRSSTGYVTVTPHPSVARHAMGYQDTHAGGIVAGLLMGAFGVAALLTGTVLAAIPTDASSRTGDLSVAGFTTLGVGAALLTAGLLVGYHSRPESQPGSTTQWSPASAP